MAENKPVGSLTRASAIDVIWSGMLGHVMMASDCVSVKERDCIAIERGESVGMSVNAWLEHGLTSSTDAMLKGWVGGAAVELRAIRGIRKKNL